MVMRVDTEVNTYTRERTSRNGLRHTTKNIRVSRGGMHSRWSVPSPDKGIRIHDTLTRLEYKEDNGTFLKRTVRLCARGDQHIEGKSFKSSDLYAPTLNLPKGSRI